jgi:DNA-binding LytR/AlgR family response regulator
VTEGSSSGAGGGAGAVTDAAAGRAAADPGPAGLSFSPRRPGFWLAWAAFGGFTAVMNALSTARDLERRGAAFRPWEPFAWEITSAIATLVLVPGLAWFVERRPWSRRPRAATAALYAAAALAFSVLHVGGMVGLRKVIYAIALGPYRFGPLPAELLYELRKDVVSFVLIVTILNLLREVERRLAAPVLEVIAAEGKASAPAAPGRIPIRDGAREVEIETAAIAAVRAAGNYVEVFRVGRPPLMLRATLGDVEERLAVAGLVRVHRSWLVAPAQVESLRPSRSGDFRAGLRDGSEVPVSRRYRDAIQRLRG